MKTTKTNVGDNYGRLTVIARGATRKSGDVDWVCLCECGNRKSFIGTHLRSGHTKSCGCLAKELSSKRNGKHRMVKTRPYRIWIGIKTRVLNTKDPAHLRYGGRGIKMSKTWSTFEGFWKDMKHGYSPRLSIDRIDNDGDYTKKNCRWATSSEQMNNRSNNRYITFKGKTMTASEWSKRLGLDRHTVIKRIEHGWSTKDAVTLKTKTPHRKLSTRKK